jgi:glutathione synthase/RimK-type ligase-like ATP-grasp enzyme
VSVPKKIAFATNREFRNLTEDDRAVIEPLLERNIEVVPLIWDDPEAWDRSDLDLVVVRSCWNYHLNPTDFLAWTNKIENSGLPLWNSKAIIEWNHDKHYLQELDRRGIPIAPTVWLKQNESGSLAKILNTEKWELAVVKPAISATSFQTWVVRANAAEQHQQRIDSMLQESGVLIQRLLHEVQTLGEWSFLFFGNRYSHAVLKRARPDEFRVQEEFGGTIESAIAAPSLLQQVQEWIKILNLDLLYARVDAVEVRSALVLMELELIEPSLFLKSDAEAAERFADAIAELLPKG